jgi:tape measure domain-containing protein
MAKAIETLSIELKFKDAGSQAIIEKLRGSLKRLEMGASGVKPRIASLRKEILAQGNASVKSVANINAQISSLKALRDEAKIGGRAFNQLTKDIAALDAQLGKSAGRQGRQGGMGARRATQAAGAVISGGIFGGPEGALGALGGLAAGGVEGAFAGAAIGAVAGSARQAIGETATFAAEINKLEIALEGVTGSGEDFESALRSAGAATRELNVPQKVAIGGITRLAAAVKGAKGPISDAELTFRNVTQAIKATGGSSEDVQGAITAMVQVFSKGKVSAEELSGQLGERLPGAVTMFAKANNMTLPQLQENLKKGTVGLNELMNFIVQLGDEFGGTATKIASSNEEAGARLQVAFDEMRLQVGEALMDTGANFQTVFGDFIERITPAAVSAAKGLAQALVPVAKNLDLIAVSLSGLVAGAALGAAVKGFIALKKAILGAKSAAALLLLNPIFGGAAAVAGIVAGIYAINKALRGQREELERIAKLGAAEGATGAQKAEAIASLRQRILTQEGIVKKYEGTGSDPKSRKAAEERVAAAKSELTILRAQLADVIRVRPKSTDQPERDFKYDEFIPDGDPKAESLAKRQKALYERLLPQLTKVNQLLNEGNKFEKERINIRFRAAALVKQIKEGVEASRQAELLALVDQNEEDAIRNVNLKEQKQILEDTFSMDFAGQFKPEQSKIQKFISDSKESLEDLQQVAINVSQGIGNAVGNALTSGVQGLIDGTQKAKDVFADFLKSVGQILAQEGAKMIATYIAIGVAKAFAGLLGGGGKFETTPLGADFGSPSGGFGGLRDFGLFTPKANGGPVNAGRPYMVGERGPELFVPGSNGGIMRNEDMRQLMGRSPVASNSPVMNFTFETTSIGGTEYVSREQLEAAMATTRRQAASDGAKRGMNMTLDRMQNSPRTRARVGIA